MITLHLRLRVAPEQTDAFLAFLAEARTLYEAPGGIRMRLYRSRERPDTWIEAFEYADGAAFALDEERVRSDPEMGATLARWRALLADRPGVEVWDEVEVG